jgi:glycosidase
MKKGMLKFLSMAFTLVLFAGCNNAIKLDSDKSSDSKDQSVAYGTLKVVNSDSSRALEISELKFAEVSVSGEGIEPGSVETVKANITGGIGSFKVEKVPVGKNRVVTVQAFDTSSSKMEGVRLRAIVDVEEGENTVTVNWASTALGNVFAYLDERGVAISSISDSDKAALTAAIDTSKHSSLINASSIAADYDASGAAGLKTKDKYVFKSASLKFTYTPPMSGYKAQVTDPCSSVTACVAGENQVVGIAPGVWNVFIYNADGSVVKSAPLKVFASGEVTDIGSLDPIVLTDIVVHTKPYKYMHYWATGQNGKSVQLKDEGNGWYGWTFENTKTINLLFATSNIVNNDWSGKTGDMSRTDCGEYWYYEGKWYNSNPEDSVAPVLQSFICNSTGTLTGDVIFTVSATDNLSLKSATIKVDGSIVENIDLSGISSSESYVWDSASVKNGSHTVTCFVTDEAGLTSEEKSVSVTTQNTNKVPVAVITGGAKATPSATKVYSGTSSYDANGSVVGYKWTVTGAATISGSDTGSSVNVKFNDSVGSTATVKLVVTDDEGASSAEVTKEVTISNATTDFREETIYFLMTTRFYDGDKSNNRYCWDDESCFKSETLGDPGWRGDFKGLIEKLDYIKALGFSAIWITPVVENASGLDYHGYHAFDFSRVDPRYESAGATYQDLIDACHAKGIKVIQDIVLNHTGNFGERNILPIMKKEYNKDDGVHSVSAVPDHDSKDIYGKSAYTKLSAGAKKQGFNTYEDIEKSSLDSSRKGEALYQSRLMTMKDDSIDTAADGMLYHHYGNFQWESYYVQEGQMAGDCVDLNTENPKVAEYLRNCYINYINMGVDGFRIDTMKHISRLTMNREFIPQFKEAGGEGFFMFGEGCVLRNEVWNAGMPGISIPFYTWKANSNKADSAYSWGSSATDAAANLAMAKTHFDDNTTGVQLTSNNHLLNGNNYRTPDYSKASGLHMIDFYMHHKFGSAGSAYSVASEEDRYFNDATYNVTYVDSHDYGPNEGGYLYRRFSGGTQAWASNLNLMFTFRGIPCVYYGSEIEFQKDMQIEPYTNGNKVPYAQSGRAYFGDHIEGTVEASDYGKYTASGKVKETLDYPLAQHIISLNKIRRAVPALQKGQYSTEGCNGNIAFKRRYTGDGVDSFVLVAINGGATFSNVPNGTYVDLVTGDKKSGTTISTGSIGEGNLRVYVLQNDTATANGATGKIITTGAYLK